MINYKGGCPWWDGSCRKSSRWSFCDVHEKWWPWWQDAADLMGLIRLLMSWCTMARVWRSWCRLFDVVSFINSLRLSDKYMRQLNIPTRVQIMACHLLCAKPLSEPTLQYCQLDPREHISVKFYSTFKSFHSRKCNWKYRLRNGGHSVSASMC